MASSLTTTDDSVFQKYSTGHLKSLSINGIYSPNGKFYFCSPNMIGLKMENISMFTLLIGKNGIGKSKILKSIRYKLNDNTDKLKSIDINSEKGMEATLIHFDTNLIDLRGEYFMQRESTTHSEVNFFEQINKEKNTFIAKSDLCDIRHILKTKIKSNDQLVSFNSLLNKSPFFNFLYDMDSCYLVLEGKEEHRRNLKEITNRNFNNFCKYLNKLKNRRRIRKNFKGYSGFLSRKQMDRFQQYKSMLKMNNIKIVEEFTFKNKKSGVKIPLLFMTSGELVLLLVLLLRFQETENKKILLMLDEPDAFLNPSCVNDFLDGLFYLVEEKQIQIIMITHNSTTVGLVAKKMKSVGNKNALVLVKEENGKIIAKQQKKDSNQEDFCTEVFHELNSDLICVDLPYKIVFVEGKDSRMYNLYYKHSHISKNVQLIFRPSGQTDESNRKGVIEVVTKATEPLTQNSISTRDETKLSNLIFGIVDKDFYSDNDSENLYILKRNCKENYLFDPIHMYFFAPSKFSIKQEYKKYTKISDILNENNSNDIFQNIIEEFFKQVVKEIPETIEKAIEHVNNEINKITRPRTAKIQKQNNYHQDKIKILGEIKKGLTKETTECEYYIFKYNNLNEMTKETRTIRYPSVLYDLSGKDLLALYNKTFKQNLNEELILKKLDSIGVFIPKDIEDIFDKICLK